MKKGFVLLELILVIIILGLSLTLIAPSLSRFSKTAELRSSTQKIAAILRSCRSEAIHKGKVYQIVFHLDWREIQVRWVEPDSTRVEEEKIRQEESPRVFTLPSWISLQEVEFKSSEYQTELPTIEFYPNGGSNGGSFLLKGEARSGYRLKVHWITGIVEIEKVA